VAKSVEEQSINQSNNINTTNSSTVQNQNISESTDRITTEEIFPTLIEFPALRSARRQRRRRVPHFDVSECFESMHQNLITMQNLVNCKNKFDDHQILQNKTIVPYDFSKSKYEVGQWVDVKDTIDQWLEAQVIQVRNNQAYVHYNGWGTRWDEWIDFSSPRIANFKTYTMQSPTTMFLSPYPSIPCDANVEPQYRTIDMFYYIEKLFLNISEINKLVDYMLKLRKKNSKHTDDFKNIKKDDFDESKVKESQTRISGIHPFLNSNDYEILFTIAQLIPLLDRSGRFLSDISLNLSHLILNPSLYPQLLLGYNQNLEVSDTLSCTSGYSMYTNEGSALSGFNTNFNEQNILNNLQRGNIQNSNQMINNYNMTGNSLSNTGTTNNNTSSSNINNNLNNPNSYHLNSSSNELPFIQRLQTSNNIGNTINNQGNSQISGSMDLCPKINLQVPCMLNPGEVAMLNGYGAYNEPNIDIYVHTLVTSNNAANTNNSSSASVSASTLINPNNNNNNNNNSVQINNNNENSSQQLNNGTSSNDNNELINNLLNTTNRNNTINSNLNTTNSTPGLSSLLENLMNMIGRGQNNRRGSPISDRSSNSASRLSFTNNNSNLQSNRNSTSDRIINNIRPVVLSNLNITGNQQVTSIFKDGSTQTDLPINLLSLQKENKLEFLF